MPAQKLVAFIKAIDIIEEGKKITEDHDNNILVVPEIKVTGYKKKKRFISIQMKFMTTPILARTNCKGNNMF